MSGPSLVQWAPGTEHPYPDCFVVGSGSHVQLVEAPVIPTKLPHLAACSAVTDQASQHELYGQNFAYSVPRSSQDGLDEQEGSDPGLRSGGSRLLDSMTFQYLSAKSLDWCPDVRDPFLVALGLSNGKVSLVRFQASSSQQNQRLSDDSEQAHIVHEFLPAGFATACTQVAWNPQDHTQIAIGLDRFKNSPAVHLWDITRPSPAELPDQGAEISRADRTNDVQTNIRKRLQFQQSPGGIFSVFGDTGFGSSRHQRSLATMAPSGSLSTLTGEGCAALQWFPQQPSTFAVGTSYRYLKIFDTRTAQTSPGRTDSDRNGGRTLSRAVLGIHAHNGPVYGARFDPFNPFVLATFSEFSPHSGGPAAGDSGGSGDPYLKVWDLRMLYRRVGVQKLAPPLFSVRLDHSEAQEEDARLAGGPLQPTHLNRFQQPNAAGSRDGKTWRSATTTASGAQKSGASGRMPPHSHTTTARSSGIAATSPAGSGAGSPSPAVVVAFSRGSGVGAIAWSPHTPGLIASVSPFQNRVRFWDIRAELSMDPQQLQTASRQQQAVSSLNSSPSEGSSTTDDVLSFPFIPVDSSRSFHDVPVAISWHTANHPQRLLVVTASGLVDELSVDIGFPFDFNPRPRSRVTAAFRDHCLLDVASIEGAAAHPNPPPMDFGILSASQHPEELSGGGEERISEEAAEDAELLDSARTMQRRALQGYSVSSVPENIALLVQEFNLLSLRLSSAPPAGPGGIPGNGAGVLGAQLGLYLENSRFLQYPWLPASSAQVRSRQRASSNQRRLRRLRLQQLQQLHRLLQMWHFLQGCQTRAARPFLEVTTEESRIQGQGESQHPEVNPFSGLLAVLAPLGTSSIPELLSDSKTCRLAERLVARKLNPSAQKLQPWTDNPETANAPSHPSQEIQADLAWTNGVSVFLSPARSRALELCGWWSSITPPGAELQAVDKERLSLERLNLDNHLSFLEQLGQHEKATALALFHLDRNRAFLSLKRGVQQEAEGDDSPASRARRQGLGLVSMALAAFRVDSAESGGVEEWRTMYGGSVVQDIRDPYLRSAFAFLAAVGDSRFSPAPETPTSQHSTASSVSGQDEPSRRCSSQDDLMLRWGAVLKDNRLALQDRIAFACRFLPDAQLWIYLGAQCLRVFKTSDLQGLLLTGLTPLSGGPSPVPGSEEASKETAQARSRNSAVVLNPLGSASDQVDGGEVVNGPIWESSSLGLELIQSYLDRSGDLQTAAVLASYFQALGVQDSRLERWTYHYRQLLNQWRFWIKRARFDVASAQLRRQLLPLALPHFTSFLQAAQDRSETGPGGSDGDQVADPEIPAAGVEPAFVLSPATLPPSLRHPALHPFALPVAKGKTQKPFLVSASAASSAEIALSEPPSPQGSPEQRTSSATQSPPLLADATPITESPSSLSPTLSEGSTTQISTTCSNSTVAEALSKAAAHKLLLSNLGRLNPRALTETPLPDRAAVLEAVVNGFLVSPQIHAHCNFCGESLAAALTGDIRYWTQETEDDSQQQKSSKSRSSKSPLSAGGSGKGGSVSGSQSTGAGVSYRQLGCPSCKKSLPRCSVCLHPMDYAAPPPALLAKKRQQQEQEQQLKKSLAAVGSSRGGRGGFHRFARPSHRFLGRRGVPGRSPAGGLGGIPLSSRQIPPAYPEISTSSVPKTPQGLSEGMLDGWSETQGVYSQPLADWFTWCLGCRHGGHARHLQSWFATNPECPVTSCKCRCVQLDPVGWSNLRKSPSRDSTASSRQHHPQDILTGEDADLDRPTRAVDPVLVEELFGANFQRQLQRLRSSADPTATATAGKGSEAALESAQRSFADEGGWSPSTPLTAVEVLRLSHPSQTGKASQHQSVSEDTMPDTFPSSSGNPEHGVESWDRSAALFHPAAGGGVLHLPEQYHRIQPHQNYVIRPPQYPNPPPAQFSVGSLGSRSSSSGAQLAAGARSRRFSGGQFDAALFHPASQQPVHYRHAAARSPDRDLRAGFPSGPPTARMYNDASAAAQSLDDLSLLDSSKSLPHGAQGRLREAVQHGLRRNITSPQSLMDLEQTHNAAQAYQRQNHLSALKHRQHLHQAGHQGFAPSSYGSSHFLHHHHHQTSAPSAAYGGYSVGSYTRPQTPRSSRLLGAGAPEGAAGEDRSSTRTTDTDPSGNSVSGSIAGQSGGESDATSILDLFQNR